MICAQTGVWQFAPTPNCDPLSFISIQLLPSVDTSTFAVAKNAPSPPTVKCTVGLEYSSSKVIVTGPSTAGSPAALLDACSVQP